MPKRVKWLFLDVPFMYSTHYQEECQVIFSGLFNFDVSVLKTENFTQEYFKLKWINSMVLAWTVSPNNGKETYDEIEAESMFGFIDISGLKPETFTDVLQFSEINIEDEDVKHQIIDAHTENDGHECMALENFESGIKSYHNALPVKNSRHYNAWCEPRISAVNYIKLYDEMFGKNTTEAELQDMINEADAVFSDRSQDKDPIKSIHFNNSNPACHTYDPDSKDGHDLLIGLNSGDVYSVSLRQQLQDLAKKPVGAQHYNKDGSVNNSRCTGIAWIPNGDGSFVVSHADGNMYVYEKNKDGSGDPSFPVIKDQTQFTVSHARYSKNPVARWHICQGSINCIAFSEDGSHLATVGRDGYLRVFDYKNEQLICGGKSYYGALLCCAWSMDGKYILAGGEDDLVQVWSMDDRKIVAWGEGHNSWVSVVAFDSYWVAPNSDGIGENIVYRFGSVGQDTQLLLWDLDLGELVVPVRRPPGGSPTFSTGSQSSHWDSACPVGTLQPSPSTRDVPKLSPLIAHRVHNEPLSGLRFTQESILTVCREGHIKIWIRPTSAES